MGVIAYIVALCYRIAGHVKQAAKEVRVLRPRRLFLAGGFLLRAGRAEERNDEQGLEPPHATGA